MADLPERPAQWSATVAARWDEFADELRRRLGPGAPLEPQHRRRFEALLARDLSRVMVHRNVLAGRLAEALRAEALTVGQHVVGGTGRLDPASRRAAALVAHEMVHAAPPVRPSGGSPASAPGVGAAVIQRDPTDTGGESQARMAESAILGADDGAPQKPAVDSEIVADLVYRRMADELVVERERGAWLR